MNNNKNITNEPVIKKSKFQLYVENLDLGLYNKYKPVFNGHQDINGIRLERLRRLSKVDKNRFICEMKDNLGTCNYNCPAKSNQIGRHKTFHEKIIKYNKCVTKYLMYSITLGLI